LLTGHNRGLVKLFDINRPDEAAVSLELKIGKARQHCRVSSIDCSPVDPNFLAIGSFDRRVYFADYRNFKRGVVSYLKIPIGMGITQFNYLHDDKHIMVASRKDNSMLLWDIRSFKEAYVKLQLSKEADTNQRLYFDIIKIDDQGNSAQGFRNLIASGNRDGSIIIYDITTEQCIGKVPS
jgi:WD40 repeat protein